MSTGNEPEGLETISLRDATRMVGIGNGREADLELRVTIQQSALPDLLDFAKGIPLRNTELEFETRLQAATEIVGSIPFVLIDGSARVVAEHSKSVKKLNQLLKARRNMRCKDSLNIKTPSDLLDAVALVFDELDSATKTTEQLKLQLSKIPSETLEKTLDSNEFSDPYYWPEDSRTIHIAHQLAIKSPKADLTLFCAAQFLGLNENRFRLLLSAREVQRYRYGFCPSELIRWGKSNGGVHCIPVYGYFFNDEADEVQGIVSRQFFGYQANEQFWSFRPPNVRYISVEGEEGFFEWGTGAHNLLAGARKREKHEEFLVERV